MTPPHGQLGSGQLSSKQFEQLIKKQYETFENYRIMNWNNHKFSYIPLDTKMLHSVFTSDNAKFKDCVQFIEEYNAEVEKCVATKSEIQNGPWKNKFYGVLQNLLREIIFTKERNL